MAINTHQDVIDLRAEIEFAMDSPLVCDHHMIERRAKMVSASTGELDEVAFLQTVPERIETAREAPGNILDLPTMNGVTVPARLPKALIHAMPAAAAVPVRSSEGIGQNDGFMP
jgi:hypothetical protein